MTFLLFTTIGLIISNNVVDATFVSMFCKNRFLIKIFENTISDNKKGRGQKCTDLPTHHEYTSASTSVVKSLIDEDICERQSRTALISNIYIFRIEYNSVLNMVFYCS